jgi:hypothetical protein
MWLLALAWAPVAASGQVGIAFEFSFSNPGARSMGFGGAFVALADDATAAFANPAGLVQLARPEVSLEARNWSDSTRFTLSGRLDGSPTGVGLDTNPGIERPSFDRDFTGLSFLSVAYPGERWALAFYRHLLANFESDFATQGLFAEGPGPLDTLRIFERRDRTELEIVTYGLSGGFEVHEKLSLGLGVAYFDGLLQGGQAAYMWDEDTLESYFGPSSFLPERQLVETFFVADGTDLGLSAGFLYRVADGWSVGGFYRQGPSFDLDVLVVGGPSSMNPDLPEGATASVSTPIRFPDVYGAGVAFRPAGGRLILSFEWDHVEYSSIFDSLGETASDEFIADGDELHLGAEYVFVGSGPPLALRAGLWRDPNHQVRSSSPSTILQGLVGQGDDELHYAFGFGAAFKTFQLDAAADFSERRDSVSVSGIYSW